MSFKTVSIQNDNSFKTTTLAAERKEFIMSLIRMLAKSKTKQDKTIAVKEREPHEKIQESGPQELNAQLPSQNESGECFL